MSMSLIFYLFMVYITQILAVVTIRYGGRAPARKVKILCFIVGNVISITSMYFFVPVFGALPDNANLAAALISGGAFVACQLGLWAVFRSRLTKVQTAGIILASVGLFMAALAA